MSTIYSMNSFKFWINISIFRCFPVYISIYIQFVWAAKYTMAAGGYWKPRGVPLLTSLTTGEGERNCWALCHMPEVLPFKIFRCLIKEEWTGLTRWVMKTKIKSNQINQSWVLHTFTLASTHKPTQHAQQIASKFCHSHIVYILHIFNFPQPHLGCARPRRGRAFEYNREDRMPRYAKTEKQTTNQTEQSLAEKREYIT